jgi:hypothetical protein
MPTTYNVRMWKTEVFKGKRGNSYRVRWIVDGEPFKRVFKSDALADSFGRAWPSVSRSSEARSSLEMLIP